MFSKRKSGQILVLVLLVVVVALAVGLSAASRNLVNLRSSTQAEQSQRAFTAAEGGVEDVLSKLTDVGADIDSGGSTSASGCVVNAGDSSADCALPTSTGSNVSGKVKVVQRKSYERVVAPGDVAQVNLRRADGNGWFGTLTVEWVNTAKNELASTLEFVFICEGGPQCMDVADPIVNGYGQHRETYTSGTISGQTGVNTCPEIGSGFTCKKTFSLNSGGACVPVSCTNVKLLRIKPFWSGTTVKISYVNGTSEDFPVQTYEITSTATTDTGVSRKVAVTRDAVAQLPAVFDYVLYSGGDIVK